MYEIVSWSYSRDSEQFEFGVRAIAEVCLFAHNKFLCMFYSHMFHLYAHSFHSIVAGKNGANFDAC